MTWTHFSVRQDAGLEELECSVCGCSTDDTLYSPSDMSEEQERLIAKIWKVDPHSDFVVCEDCMEGHCGAVRGLDADNWLEEQYRRFLEGQKTGAD